MSRDDEIAAVADQINDLLGDLARTVADLNKILQARRPS
jgi:ABC-type transporter Mla subunit MlaD